MWGAVEVCGWLRFFHCYLQRIFSYNLTCANMYFIVHHAFTTEACRNWSFPFSFFLSFSFLWQISLSAVCLLSECTGFWRGWARKCSLSYTSRWGRRKSGFHRRDWQLWWLCKHTVDKSMGWCVSNGIFHCARRRYCFFPCLYIAKLKVFAGVTDSSPIIFFFFRRTSCLQIWCYACCVGRLSTVCWHTFSYIFPGCEKAHKLPSTTEIGIIQEPIQHSPVSDLSTSAATRSPKRNSYCWRRRQMARTRICYWYCKYKSERKRFYSSCWSNMEGARPRRDCCVTVEWTGSFSRGAFNWPWTCHGLWYSMAVVHSPSWSARGKCRKCRSLATASQVSALVNYCRAKNWKCALSIMFGKSFYG